MNTMADLLVILTFLSGLYMVLGLLCGIVEKVQDFLAKPHQRRRARKSPQRRTPRRGVETVNGCARFSRPIGTAARREAA